MASDVEVARDWIPWIEFHEGDFWWKRLASAQLDSYYFLKWKSLFYLFGKLKNKKRSVTRDRIFWLLALCHGDLRPLVSSETSHEDLARGILLGSKESFCLCSIRLIISALQIKPGLLTTRNPSLLGTNYFAQLVLPTVGDTMPCWWELPKIAVSDYQTAGRYFTIDLKHICESCSG
jgi:hypothetical protein